MYLTDLTFIEDGIPSIIKKTNLINFAKRAKTAEVIRDIQQYQNVLYALQPVSELQDYILSNMQAAGDVHEMYDKSLLIEPREREDEKIVRYVELFWALLMVFLGGLLTLRLLQSVGRVWLPITDQGWKLQPLASLLAAPALLVLSGPSMPTSPTTNNLRCCLTAVQCLLCRSVGHEPVGRAYFAIQLASRHEKGSSWHAGKRDL